MNVIHLSTDLGDVEIREDELPSLTKSELKEFRISREELHRVFAEGVKLMQDVHPRERLRPLASETWEDGKWDVRLVRYSDLTDPMLQGPPSGNA